MCAMRPKYMGTRIEQHMWFLTSSLHVWLLGGHVDWAWLHAASLYCCGCMQFDCIAVVKGVCAGLVV